MNDYPKKLEELYEEMVNFGQKFLSNLSKQKEVIDNYEKYARKIIDEYEKSIKKIMEDKDASCNNEK